MQSQNDIVRKHKYYIETNIQYRTEVRVIAVYTSPRTRRRIFEGGGGLRPFKI